MKLSHLDRVFAALVFLTGGYVAVSAYGYGLYRNDVPGPGFFPMIAGAMMIALAGAILLRDLRGRQVRLEGVVAPPVAFAIAGVTAAILAFVWVAPVTGMTIAAFAVMVVVGLLTEEPGKRGRAFVVRLVIVSAATVAVCHLLFARLIGIPLIEGPLGF